MQTSPAIVRGFVYLTVRDVPVLPCRYKLLKVCYQEFLIKRICLRVIFIKLIVVLEKPQ